MTPAALIVHAAWTQMRRNLAMVPEAGPYQREIADVLVAMQALEALLEDNPFFGLDGPLTASRGGQEVVDLGDITLRPQGENIRVEIAEHQSAATWSVLGAEAAVRYLTQWLHERHG